MNSICAILIRLIIVFTASKLSEELTRIEHHDLEAIGSTSPELADTKGKTIPNQERFWRNTYEYFFFGGGGAGGG